MTLSPRASFWTAASVVGLALWASGAPTRLYLLYAQDSQLAPAVTTAIFATYPLVLMPVLAVFGNLSDVIGRRASSSSASSPWPPARWPSGSRRPHLGLRRPRAQGVGVGLSLSPATAAMVEFGGRDAHAGRVRRRRRRGRPGLALATLIGGALVEYSPSPLHLSFWVLVAVTVLVGGFADALPRHTRDEGRAAGAGGCPAHPATTARLHRRHARSPPPTHSGRSTSRSAPRPPATSCQRQRLRRRRDHLAIRDRSAWSPSRPARCRAGSR